MFDDIRDAHPAFWTYLDSVSTCLLGDRHKGLLAAVKEKFSVADSGGCEASGATSTVDTPFLRNCRGHIKANIRGKRSVIGDLKPMEWQELVDNLAECSTIAQVDEQLAKIKAESPTLHYYIVHKSDYVQWVRAFAPTRFDLGQTTTNAVEIENARLKALEVRHKSIRDILPAIIDLCDKILKSEAYSLGGVVANAYSNGRKNVKNSLLWPKPAHAGERAMAAPLD